MRKIALIFLLCYTLYPSVYAQKCGLERDSLSVFVVRDETSGAILDDFVAEAKKIDCLTPTAYHIYIDLFDTGLTDEIHFLLDRAAIGLFSEKSELNV